MLRKCKLPFFLALTGACALNAATYYVTTNGDDSNDGSQAAPWLTIQHAADSVSAGDAVMIEPGRYDGATFNNSGAPGNPITFIGSDVVITNNLSCSSDNITISSVICSPPVAGGYYAITVDGENDVLTNCTVVNYGAAASDQATAIGIGGMSNLVVNCIIRDLDDIDAFHVFGRDQTILGCVVTNLQQVNYAENHTDFIQTWGAGTGSYNVLIKNCLLVNSTCQIGNTETDGSSDLHDWTFENDVFANVANTFFSGLPNTRFYNCVFYKCAGPGSPLDTPITFYTISTNYNSAGSEVVNCVFLECGSTPSDNWEGAIGSNGTDLSSLLIAYNYFAGSDYEPKSIVNGAYIGTSYVNGGNPYFANEPNYDFHLTSGSVLIGAGTNLFAIFLTDRDGNAWPSSGAWDIGTYRYIPVVALHAVQFQNDRFLFTFDTLSNLTYTLQVSTDLVNWTSISNLTGSGGPLIVSNLASGGSSFYRLQMP